MVSKSDSITAFPVQDFPVGTAPDLSFSRVRSFEYKPELDAIRGIAVGVVMLYHLGLFFEGFVPPIAGGFLGVDVFFVLSGFLITSVLIRENSNAGQINLKNFYLRRI